VNTHHRTIYTGHNRYISLRNIIVVVAQVFIVYSYTAQSYFYLYIWIIKWYITYTTCISGTELLKCYSGQIKIQRPEALRRPQAYIFTLHTTIICVFKLQLLSMIHTRQTRTDSNHTVPFCKIFYCLLMNLLIIFR
jgi:hypothetical protein